MNEIKNASADAWPPQTQEDIDAQLKRTAKLGGDAGLVAIFDGKNFRTWNKEKQRIEVQSEQELFGDLLYEGTRQLLPSNVEGQWKVLSDFIGTALDLGQEIPKNGCADAGEMFLENGKPVEVRLRGRITPDNKNEDEGDWELPKQMPWDKNWESYPEWSTPVAPRFRNVGRDLMPAPEDEGRAFIAFSFHLQNFGPPRVGLPKKQPVGEMTVSYRLRDPENEPPEPPEPDAPKPIETTAEFSFHTSQEMNALSCAQSHGKTFAGYMMNEQAGAIVHQCAGAAHLIRMELTEDERAAGLALDYLEGLARAQDADAVLATAYILGVLAPPPHLPARVALGWIDFNDVLKKIGWTPRNAKDRREMHAKIWNFVKFGERAQLIGKRTGAKYKLDGEEIDTTIHGAAWRVMKTETLDPPTQRAAPETPVCVQIVVSPELTALISNRTTAQYFQCGEVLGAIPGGQSAGAWARVIGLALLSFWRRKPHEHNAGTLKPTRRELLNHYAAKISPYNEILESNDPSRAIDYWCGALQILADERFIERTGEAAMRAKEMRAGLPRQDWQSLWLDQTVTIEIGAKTKPAFEKLLKSLHAPKPRDLKKKLRVRKPATIRQQTAGVRQQTAGVRQQTAGVHA
jgi:hypothetical protein